MNTFLALNITTIGMVVVLIGSVISLLSTSSGWNAFLRITRIASRVTFNPPLPDNLIFRPTIVTERQAIAIAIVAGGIALAIMVSSTTMTTSATSMMTFFGWRLGSTMVVSMASLLLVGGGTVWYLRHRYITSIEQSITVAMDRLATAMDSGRSFSQALASVVASLPPSPLRAEWQWLLERLGALRHDGTRLMLHEVCALLAAQTLSPRQATVLLRLSDALNRPHDAQVAAIRTIVAAMNDSAKRESTMTIELAQLRTSGIAIFLINVGITIYLSIMQMDKVLKAYGTPFGIAVAIGLGLMMIAPLVIGEWLSRVDDVTY